MLLLLHAPSLANSSTDKKCITLSRIWWNVLAITMISCRGSSEMGINMKTSRSLFQPPLLHGSFLSPLDLNLLFDPNHKLLIWECQKLLSTNPCLKSHVVIYESCEYELGFFKLLSKVDQLGNQNQDDSKWSKWDSRFHMGRQRRPQSNLFEVRRKASNPVGSLSKWENSPTPQWKALTLNRGEPK